MAAGFFFYLSWQDILAASIALLFLLLAVLAPRLGDRAFTTIETSATRFASRRRYAILALAVLPILARLCLLVVMPRPVPRLADEFSYLLASDTFAHARLTNPPHPLWKFFDTVYVNQHPTYMSKYPPAQGAVLALGQLLGHPWFGVLIGVGAMCGAILWALQGWLPPRWALAGATLIALHLAIFSYWANSYWGGAVAAAGGALVLGALPRILHHLRARDAVILGIGAAILANSRPVEGFLFCAPVFIYLAWRLIAPRLSPRQVSLSKIILPLASALLLAAIFMAYYNWRGTGHALLFPYTLNEQTYSSAPLFVWQKLRPSLHYTSPQLEYVFDGWAHRSWARASIYGGHSFALHIAGVLAKFVYFFLFPALWVPFLTLPALLRDRKMRLPLIQAALCLLGFIGVVWFEPHYAAPLTVTIALLLAQSLRHLRQWQPRGRPVGVALTCAVFACAIVMSFIYIAEATRDPYAASFIAPAGVWAEPGNLARAQIAAELEAMPGDHLIIVRYATPQTQHGEMVYNAADIDHAKVIWARQLPNESLQPLLDYYPHRQIWLLEADATPPSLTPYQ